MAVKYRTDSLIGTDGYRAIMREVRTDDIAHDPWGTGMAWLFGLAEVYYAETGEALPEFTPSPFGAVLEGHQCETVSEFLASGIVTLDDIQTAFTVLSRFDDWCRLAGRNY